MYSVANNYFLQEVYCHGNIILCCVHMHKYVLAIIIIMNNMTVSPGDKRLNDVTYVTLISSTS